MGIPKSLRERLRARHVIPFVGAGVSRAVKKKSNPQEPLFPNWSELLDAAAECLEAEQKFQDAAFVRKCLGLEHPKYHDAAKRARDKLGPQWHQFLKQRIDLQHDMADTDSLALAEAVWNLGSNLVITTNYDHVLQLTAPGIRDLQYWDIEAPTEQACTLRSGTADRPTVWHLHGHIGNETNIILTPDGYDLLYPPNGTEAKYKAALETLRQFLTTRSFLFVGYSMDDIRLVETVRKIHDIFSGAVGPHYVLAAGREEERIRQSIQQVEVVTFADLGQPLLDLMKTLREAAEENANATGSPLVSLSTPSKVADYDPRKSVFHVPYRQKGNQVIGREKALDDLRRQLTTGKRTNIGHAASFDGIGGLGKTQLAIEYAYRYKNEYPNGVIWLDADRDIGTQLVQLAEAAQWVARESDRKPKYDIALHRLRSYSECLIIFDNLEDLAAIQDYLPEPQAEPHILVTSRKAYAAFVPVELNPLDLDDSLTLLVQEAGRKPDSESEKAAARGIAQDLAGLPLALELAGAYMRYLPSVAWSEYHILLQGNLEKALSVNDLGSFTEHDRDLFATLTIDEKILNEQPLLAEILDLLTWSARASMSRSLLGAMLGVADENDLVPPLALGVRLRLLKRLPDSDRHELHPLVLEVRRKQRPISGRNEWVQEMCSRFSEWLGRRSQHPANLPHLEAEIDHLEAWKRNAVPGCPAQAAELAWLQHHIPSYHGRYNEAKNCLLNALALMESGNVNDALPQALVYNDLALMYLETGDFDQALTYANRAYEAHIAKHSQKEDVGTLALYDNLGSIYLGLRDYQQALRFKMLALNGRRAVLGASHRDTAMSLSNLGALYFELGRDQEALESLEHAFEIQRDACEERHPDIARIRLNLGAALVRRGRYQEGLAHAIEGLKVTASLFGDNHPTTIDASALVGAILGQFARRSHEKGEHTRANAYLAQACALEERVLEARKATCGYYNRQTADAFNNLSVSYGETGRSAEASEYALEALRIHEALFGDRSREVAGSRVNIAIQHRNSGRFDESVESLSMALSAYEQSSGVADKETVDTAYLLAGGLFQLGRAGEARTLLHRFLKSLSPEHPDYERLKRLKQHPPKAMKQTKPKGK